MAFPFSDIFNSVNDVAGGLNNAGTALAATPGFQAQVAPTSGVPTAPLGDFDNGFVGLGAKYSPNGVSPFNTFLTPQYQQAAGQLAGQQQKVSSADGLAQALQQATSGAPQAALGSQLALANALQAQGGIQNQSSVFGQQQALANQLGLMAQGGGPNPAQAQLAQNTGANVANQAALMAGQRGAGSNVGLIAREAAQQGANTQQQAVGQAATLQAQQQLAAIGALQGQQGMLGNLAQAQTGQAIASGQNATNSALGVQNLNQNYGTQQQQFALQGQNLAQQQLQNAAANQQAQNALGVQQNLGLQGIAAGGAQSAAGIAAGAVQGIAAGVGAGLTKHSAGGVISAPQTPNLKENYGSGSRVIDFLSGYASGGKVKALVSPGEIYLRPDQANKVAEGKMNPMAGERIPGKAKVKGDSPQNDTVPKTLEVGGVVVKRTKAQDPEAAKRFVAALKSRKGSK